MIAEVNDWYFPMLHDTRRNEFFWESLKAHVAGKHVLDVGSGCGLLSLMALRLGAARVTAVESMRDVAALAVENARRNNAGDRIRVVHGRSQDLTLAQEDLADVVVSETLGTLLLGEGVLENLADARQRLARPEAVMLPGRGAQYVVLVSSPTLASLCGAPNPAQVYGFDLSATNSLQDTASIYFTKDRGVRLDELPDLELMSERVCVAAVKFGTTRPQDIPRSSDFELCARRAGTIHAAVASWEVWSDSNDAEAASAGSRLSTALHVEGGLHRDMQWGQGIQLMEDHEAAPRRRTATGRQLRLPQAFEVEEGERLVLSVRWSEPDRRALQFRLRRAGAAT